MTEGIFLGLGGNIGDVHATFAQAKQLMQKEGIQLITESSFYKTKPFGPVEQDDFLNQVIQIETSLSPQELLEACLRAEQELGRKREIKWGPRTIDIDLLLYNQVQMETDNLVLPHPGMQERHFVLLPFVEIAPKMMHPGLQKVIQELADALPQKEHELEKL